MKKIFITLSLILLVFLVSGCSKEKTLSCSISVKTENYGEQTTTYIMTFQKDSLTKGEETVEIVLDEIMANYVDSFYQSFEEVASQYKDTEGLEATVEKIDRTIKFHLKADILAENQDLTTIFNYDTTKSYDELKKYFEENEYTCK